MVTLRIRHRRNLRARAITIGAWACLLTWSALTLPVLTLSVLTLSVWTVVHGAPGSTSPGASEPRGYDARLDAIEDTVDQATQNIQANSRASESERQRADRRLVDAQVAFGVGSFDDAAVLLYDYVEKYPDSPSHDMALYYLGEALFQKRDYMASRTYFRTLVRESGANSKYYQQSLERLIELSIALRDDADIEEWLSALDRIPSSQWRPSVPYVRGKYAYFRNRFERALAYFAAVPPGTEYYVRALYFIGTAFVASGDGERATAAFADLLSRHDRRQNWSAEDERTFELAYLALGRMYYEGDRPAAAIEQYLEVDRKSDLFDEALYEIAWVYVKHQQYDKALRALELLALSDPTSTKLPSVKILEGNLRIRKAQGESPFAIGNSAEEYSKALAVFNDTHQTFDRSHRELQRIIEEHTDPQLFLNQITGRVSQTFEVSATLPEVAAAWLREIDDMELVIAIEEDLGEIGDDIDQSERIIERLEQAVAKPSRVNVFPALADKRTQITESLELLLALRGELSDRLGGMAIAGLSGADQNRLRTLARRRQGLARDMAALPRAQLSYGERIARARTDYVVLDQRAAELSTLIDSTTAALVALEKYVRDQEDAGAELARGDEARKTMGALKTELDDMRDELEQVRRQATLGKDVVGTGDEVAVRAAELRTALRAALDEEFQFLTELMRQRGGADASMLAELYTALGRASRVTQKIDNIFSMIDEIVEVSLAEVRVALAEEKARLASYKRAFLAHEAESRQLGAIVLGASFAQIKDKFYDILIRCDVGVIDVSWSQKEDSDESVRKLNLDRLRELRTLSDEFRDVLDEGDLEGELEGDLQGRRVEPPHSDSADEEQPSTAAVGQGARP